MDYKDLLDLVEKRRSIRRFKPDPIPDDYVEKIIDVARWAPSGFNQQPWEFVVVKKPELKSKIVEYCNESRKLAPQMEVAREAWQKTPHASPMGSDSDFTVAPVFILLFGDNRTLEGLPMGVRYDATRQNTVFVSGLANAFLYMTLAATSLGLASQWVSSVSTPFSHCMIKNLLGIPEKMSIYDMMVTGYSALQPSPKLLRDRTKMVHYDYCGEENFRTDEEVRDFIKKSRTWNLSVEAKKPNK